MVVNKKKVSKKSDDVSVEKKKSVVNDSVNVDKHSKGFVFKKSFFGLVFFILLLVLFYFMFFVGDVGDVGDGDNDSVNSYEFYNGFEFRKHSQLNNVWITTINIDGVDQEFEFRYHPLDLERFEFDSDINQYFYLTQLADGEVYSVLYSEVLEKQSGFISLASYDLIRILRTIFDFRVDVAAEGLEDYPWITCDEANVETLVVEFRHGEPKIDLSPFCVRLYFDDPEDSLRLSSLLIYNLLGIMD